MIYVSTRWGGACAPRVIPYGRSTIEFIPIMVYWASHESRYAESALEGVAESAGKNEKILSRTLISIALRRNVT
jgi:hypothetical protein